MLSSLRLLWAITLAPQAWPAPAAAPDRVALLVGVGAYPSGSGWARLGAAQDLDLLEAALHRQGVEEIIRLQDRAATRAGVKHALTVELPDRIDRGDVVYVHFSGHGTRIPDDDPSEEPDGLDEALVPYDHVQSPSDPTLAIRDDVLHGWLDALRLQLGPQGHLFVSIDACFSGSATRGSSLPTRGSLQSLPVPPSAGTDTGSGVLTEDAPVLPEAELAPMAVLSAARFDQPANETWLDGDRPAGAFSVALAGELGKAGPTTSYRALRAATQRALDAMGKRQETQLEGVVDGQVLGGTAVASSPWLVAGGLQADQTVLVPGGLLAGMGPGTKVGFRATGSVSSDRFLATGAVERAEGSRAFVRVDPGGAEPASLKGTWAVITERDFGTLAVRVRLDPALPPRLDEALRHRLGSNGAFTLVEQGEELEVTAAGRRVRIWSDRVRDTPLLELPAATDEEVATVVQQVQHRASALYFRNLELDAESLDVLAWVVPATRTERQVDGLPCTARTAGAEATTRPVLAQDEVFQLVVENRGASRAWINALILTPDGRVGDLFGPNAARSDIFVEPDATRVLGCFQVSGAPGIEVLKILATTSRLELPPLEPSDNRTRASMTTLGALIDQPFGTAPSASRVRMRGSPGEAETTTTSYELLP